MSQTWQGISEENTHLDVESFSQGEAYMNIWRKRNDLSFNRQLSLSSEHPALLLRFEQNARVPLGEKFTFHREVFKQFATWLLPNNEPKHCAGTF